MKEKIKEIIKIIYNNIEKAEYIKSSQAKANTLTSRYEGYFTGIIASDRSILSLLEELLEERIE